MSKTIPTSLCDDHFQRLISKDVCATCPSQVENEAVVKKLAELQKESTESVVEALMIDFHSVRSELESCVKTLAKLEHKVEGNGSKGIDKRLLVLETKIEDANDSRKNTITLISVICAMLFSIIGIVINLTQ